jgi:hypothetical protein
LAKNVTGHSNESQAIKDFQDLLTDRSQYYNKQPFPQSESFAEARKNCLGVDNAKKFCPKRWEALQIWFDEEAKVISACRLIFRHKPRQLIVEYYLHWTTTFQISLAGSSHTNNGSVL